MNGADFIASILAHIRERQDQPEGTGNPEGRTEMHSYHVWEVLNALSGMRAEDGR